MIKGVQLRVFSFYWGIVGVIAILSTALFRLTPIVMELDAASLNNMHWLALLTFVPYMAYAEGYKGFYLNFSPRIIARAKYLRNNDTFLPALLAPLFCMGFFHATRKRMITSFLVTSAIIVAVMVVKISPQPLRGIIDAGVVVGLAIGLCSLLMFWLKIEFGTWDHEISADLPTQSS